MKMADEDMIYLAGFNIKAEHLHLSAFSTIYQVQVLIDIKHLRRRISVKYRCCWTASQYGYLKSHNG